MTLSAGRGPHPLNQRVRPLLSWSRLYLRQPFNSIGVRPFPLKLRVCSRGWDQSRHSVTTSSLPYSPQPWIEKYKVSV